MRRSPRSLRHTYRLLRKAGIGALVGGVLLAALFPGRVKQGFERLFGGEDPVASPVVEVVPEPEPLPEAEPAPPPPPPPPPPRPLRTGPPRTAVVGIGDPRVADRLGGLLVEALGREGLAHVHDGGRSLRVRDLVSELGGAPPASRLASVLEREGYSALVLAEGFEVASRELAFYGRTDLATKWRVQVSAYRLDDQRGVGPGWRGEVETTERGALASLQHFLEPIASQVAPVVEESLGGS